MTREEILNLHTLSEEEQGYFLFHGNGRKVVLEALFPGKTDWKHYAHYGDKGVTCEYCGKFAEYGTTIGEYGDCPEPNITGRKEISLADCAFRLRDEAYGRDMQILDEGMRDVWEADGSPELGYEDWFNLEAKPVHWIQAALLAKLEVK